MEVGWYRDIGRGVRVQKVPHGYRLQIEGPDTWGTGFWADFGIYKTIYGARTRAGLVKRKRRRRR